MVTGACTEHPVILQPAPHLLPPPPRNPGYQYLAPEQLIIERDGLVKTNESDRKTMGIEVHPDEDVVDCDHVDANQDKIREKLNKCTRWILKQLPFFKGIAHRNVTKEYLSCKAHKY